MAHLYKKLLLLSLLYGCVSTGVQIQPPSSPDQPWAEREFRAAWVATVANIDWPSKPGLAVETQKQEALAILDSAAALHLNAIVFQVRPQCDAMYPSKREPWSYYLTGVQGQPPEPRYDPLAFWIEEAHDRGLELHAWFNPYRAHHPAGGEIGDSSVVRRLPELARDLNNGYHWLDPGEQRTQDHSFNVIMDVVRRYDLDGVHFDDYFYPYGDGNFPDDNSWNAYKNNGGKLGREDWRRDNVNRFIQRVYEAIKKEKKHVKFGLSPFGIYRPYQPYPARGFDQYETLYADARLWLNKGWVDYWTPQLYWPVNQIPQSFPVLMGWWVQENTKNRNLWPGLFTSRVADEKGIDENLNQIMIARGFVPDAPGHVHFSMKALHRDTLGLNRALLAGPYRQQALVPPSPWLDNKPPQPPAVRLSGLDDDSLHISWTHADENDVFRWIVYMKMGDQWRYIILNRNVRNYRTPLFEMVKTRRSRDTDTAEDAPSQRIDLTEIAVSAVDRTGNESVIIKIRL